MGIPGSRRKKWRPQTSLFRPYFVNMALYTLGSAPKSSAREQARREKTHQKMDTKPRTERQPEAGLAHQEKHALKYSAFMPNGRASTKRKCAQEKLLRDNGER